MNRWICTEGDGYNIWGKGIHGEYVFAGGDVQSLMILYKIMKWYKKIHMNKFGYRTILFV